MQIEEAIEEYLLNVDANGRSMETVKWYRSILNSAKDKLPGQLDNITAHDVRIYLQQLRQTGRYIDAPQKPQQAGKISYETVAAHNRALRAFFSWCADEYNIENPMANIKRPTRRKPQPKGVARTDFIKLLNATSNEPIGMRDRAMLTFFADTGARLSGVINLTLDNLFINERTAIVTEKGEKSRRVYYTFYTAELLMLWLKHRPKTTAQEVFISMNTLQAITSSGVHQMIKRLKKRAGVTGRVNPHGYRHGFARAYLQNGGDLVTLGRLLGHEDINTTALYYAVFSDDELKEFHKKHSPLNNPA